jgi:hypothetical protein
MQLRGSLDQTMLSGTTSELYVNSLRRTLGRLERNGDLNDPWIAEFKHNLLEHIAKLGRVDEASVAKKEMQLSNGPDTHQSFRETVLVSGTLAIPGAVANCIVRATKITIVNLQDSEYVDADVALAPPHLPDGQYELHFEGRRIQVRNSAGRWSS